MKEENYKTNHQETNMDQETENSDLHAADFRSKENPTKHSLCLLKAALPYADSKSRHSMDIMLKATELIDSIHNSSEDELSATSLNDGKGDIEGMLNSIIGLCTDKEKDIVDMMINLMKAKKYYNTYRAISLSAQSSQNKKADGGNPYAKMFGLDENVSMMEVLSSMLTPEQKSTFDNLSMILNAVPTSMP